MSDRYVVLLRGVNLGPHKKVAMADLRSLLEGAGYGDVRTLLNSGNVTVTSERGAPGVEDDLARLVESGFGFRPRVMVRTAAELVAVVAACPFPEAAAQPKGFHIGFLSAPADPSAVADVDPASVAPERFHLRGRELYLHCPDGFAHSLLIETMTERRLGAAMTIRTWGTATKLLAQVQAASG